MRFLHTLDPDQLRDMESALEDAARAAELAREDETMEHYYERKEIKN